MYTAFIAYRRNTYRFALTELTVPLFAASNNFLLTLSLRFASSTIIRRPIRVFTSATMKSAAVQMVFWLFLFNSATSLLAIIDYDLFIDLPTRNIINYSLLYATACTRLLNDTIWSALIGRGHIARHDYAYDL